MKITKYVHSCVLVQDGERSVLIDPGIFSWQSGLVNVATLPVLDAIYVTHLHGDHMAEPFVKALLAAQPNVLWVAPTDAAEQLRAWGVVKVSQEPVTPDQVRMGDHALLDPLGPTPQNMVLNVSDKLTHPGDSHTFTETKSILCLPVDGPWGSTLDAVRLAIQLKPRCVLPIHDSMWNDSWRQNWYQNIKSVLEQNKIEFLWPKDGETIDIDI